MAEKSVRSFEERRDARVEQAKQDGARVIVPKSFDVYAAIGIVKQLDNLFINIRKRAYTPGYEGEKVEEMVIEWNEMVAKMNALGVKISDTFPNEKYYPPQIFATEKKDENKKSK